jgi:hypothetical protein
LNPEPEAKVQPWRIRRELKIRRQLNPQLSQHDNYGLPETAQTPSIYGIVGWPISIRLR